MKAVRQIYAIARTEFRFGLRRGAPVVVTAVIGLLVGAAILLMPLMNLDGLKPDFGDMSPEQVQRLAAKGITPDSYRPLIRDSLADLIAYAALQGWQLMLLAVLFLPLATAPTVPADRTFGVHELLRSTPLDGTTYLAGKILGVLGTVFIIGAFPLLAFFAVIEFTLLGSVQSGIPFYLVKFLAELILMDGVPIFVFGAVVGVLVGVVCHSRRAALLPGFLAGVLGLIFWATVFSNPLKVAFITDAAAYRVFQGYTDAAPRTFALVFGEPPPQVNPGLLGEGAWKIGNGTVIDMYLILFGLLILLAVLARLWLMRKENF